ncbi:MAG: hypothetical protein ACW980_25340 [Promethearchaeota archaeon]
MLDNFIISASLTPDSLGTVINAIDCAPLNISPFLTIAISYLCIANFKSLDAANSLKENLSSSLSIC